MFSQSGSQFRAIENNAILRCKYYSLSHYFMHSLVHLASDGRSVSTAISILGARDITEAGGHKYKAIIGSATLSYAISSTGTGTSNAGTQLSYKWNTL